MFSELPYAGKAFNVGNQQWEGLAEDQDPHVPLLGLAGRVGAVCSAAKHRDAALELLAWLSSNSSGDPASAASPATTLYRRSQLKSAINWVEKPVSPAAASQYAAITETTFRRSQWLEAPRIPGRDEYLAALDRGAPGGAIQAIAGRRAATGGRPMARDHRPAGSRASTRGLPPQLEPGAVIMASHQN